MLTPGTRFGPYEIVNPIGSGGMGEVYRARDTRLDRTVAIKVLPESVAGAPDRLARFEREAKTLAAFNHTNIAQVYGLEQGALAMEFVEGEDLSQLISRGPLPVDEALAIASQIADALEAAHEAGIIHRDLKPSNVRVRADGTVKVLDFGLAKALDPPTSSMGATTSPTMTSPAITELGVILGTAGYMSPEQARGKAVDRRADIWAFGVVLYELTTGRRPFDGDTVTEAIAAVLKSEPDLTPVPARLRRLVGSCLEKDPKRRLRDIGDWRRQLDDVTTAATAAGRSSRLPWAVAAVVAAAAGVLALRHFSERSVVPAPFRFHVAAPAQTLFESGLSVAPDGRRVAFVARDAAGVARIWVRDFDSLQARPLAGTEGGRSPIWRPDGQFLAFVVNRWLKKVPVSGGPVVTLCEAAPNALGSGSWNQFGDILIGGVIAGALRRVSDTGDGAVSAVTAVDPSRAELTHGLPAFLPDGRHFIYLRVSRDAASSGLFLGSLDRTPAEQPTDRLVEADSQGAYVAVGSGQGRLLFLRKGTLFAQPFDVDRLVTSGEARPVAEGISNTGALGFFSAAPDALVYRTGPLSGAGRQAQMTRVDRTGKPLSTVGSPNVFISIEIAPDGSRTAVEYGVIPNPDIWLIDRRGVAERFTSHPAVDRTPVWSSDGSRIAFQSNRNNRIFDLYVKSLSGSAEELLVKSPSNKSPTSWSSDGRFLLYSEVDPKTHSDLWVLPFRGEPTPIVLLRTEFAESSARFSPDTQWIAYVSDASGQNEVYVRPFDPSAPGAAARSHRVSRDGGIQPRWARDGKELVFKALDGTLMAVDIAVGKTFQLGIPGRLFFPPAGEPWDVGRDGQRLLLSVPTEAASLAPITVVLNWTSDLVK